MAWLESNHGRLLVGFRFRGARCREYLGLDDNRDNRRFAARIIRDIELENRGRKIRLRRCASQTARILNALDSLRPQFHQKRDRPSADSGAWSVCRVMARRTAPSANARDRL